MMLCSIPNTKICMQIKFQPQTPLEYTVRLLKEAKIDVFDIIYFVYNFLKSI